MKERQRKFLVEGNTLPEAYHNALIALYEHGIEVPCPNYNTNQKEISLSMVVKNPLEEPMISRFGWTYPNALERYRQEFLDGILDFEIEYGNWDYTYHDLMKEQIPWIIDVLTKDPHSRQAVITLPNEKTRTLNSPPCLQLVQYFIRDNENKKKELLCEITMRSNDALKASFQNAFVFIMLQQRMAEKLGIEKLGSYIHNATSYHVYENDYEELEACMNRMKSGGPLTYDYIGDWDEQMEEEREDIAKLVLDLKKDPKEKIKQFG